jgi:hypothetical protein
MLNNTVTFTPFKIIPTKTAMIPTIKPMREVLSIVC